MNGCHDERCHECQEHQGKLAALQVTATIARCVLTGVLGLFLMFMAGCLISHEWTLKQLREVKGRVNVRSKDMTLGEPAFIVEVTPDNGKGGK